MFHCTLAEGVTSDIGGNTVRLRERKLKVNVARGKEALQSSTSNVEYGALKAIDANINTCSFTRPEVATWWQVDLKAVYKIVAVVITTPTHGELKHEAG